MLDETEEDIITIGETVDDVTAVANGHQVVYMVTIPLEVVVTVDNVNWTDCEVVVSWVVSKEEVFGTTDEVIIVEKVMELGVDVAIGEVAAAGEEMATEEDVTSEVAVVTEVDVATDAIIEEDWPVWVVEDMTLVLSITEVEVPKVVEDSTMTIDSLVDSILERVSTVVSIDVVVVGVQMVSLQTSVVIIVVLNWVVVKVGVT